MYMDTGNYKHRPSTLLSNRTS